MITYMEQMKQRHKNNKHNKFKINNIKEKIGEAVDNEDKFVIFTFISPSEAWEAKEIIKSLGFELSSEIWNMNYHEILVDLREVYK